MDLIKHATPLVVLPNPLIPEGKRTYVAEFLPGETLGKYIRRNGVGLPRSKFRVWHNARPVPMSLWDRLIPRTGDQIMIQAIAEGGGGGGKVLRTVAMIALVLAAPYVAGYLQTGAWAAATGFTGGLLTAGITIGGSLLIGALLPAPKPTLPQLTSGGKYETSPTYAISGGRNRARPWEPMPIIFGRHKVVPDLGAQYYTEYVGDDMYLNQIFHFGLQGLDLALGDIKIGQTPISNYQGVQIQISGANGRLSMFPGNVDTLQGFALASGVVNTRTTAINTTHIKVELAARLFYVRDDAGIDARSVDVRIQYRPVGGSWTDIGLLQDAIYATHYWSLEATIFAGLGGALKGQLDYGSTNYGEHYEGEPVTDDRGRTIGRWRWKPHPFRLGQPWYGIAPDPIIGYSSSPGVRMTGARQEVTRQTVQWSVAPGQYEIRIWKVSGDINGSRESNETAVGQILAYQPDTADYTGQCRMAVRIKATGQLNGAVDELNAIAEASCLVWNGSAWVFQHTRNPAWWFLHFARGRFINGKRVYGAGLTDAQIDIDRIKAWALFCQEKGLTFDYVLDRKMSTDEMLQIIARAGRASKTRQTGKLGVVWDAANLPVTAMFGPFNIKAGTFRVDYINEGNVDEVVVNFANEARGYEMDEVRVKVPGATTTTNPFQLDLEGCTNAVMAGREANLIAASQVWHRRRTSWETDIEGWLANRGDVVQISHDLTVWGYSGRLLGRVGNVITLDKHVPSGGTGTLMIRDPQGSMKTVSVVSLSGDVDELTIVGDMSDFALPGDPLPGEFGFDDVVPMDWAWFFDPLATPGRRFKILSVEPTEDGVKFSAVDDDPEYYASETNPYQYTPPKDGALLAGIILSISANERIINVQADISDVTFSWSASRQSAFDVMVTINGQSRPAVRSDDRQITVQAKTDDAISITVTPIASASLKGTPSTLNYNVLGLRSETAAVTGLTNVFRDGLTVLRWEEVNDVRPLEYEIRLGPTWANARTVAKTVEREAMALGNGLYWVAARFVGSGYTIYGPPDSLSISGAVLVRNVLETLSEHTAWGGSLSDGATLSGGNLTLAGSADILGAPDILDVADVLSFGGPQSFGIYTSSKTVDIGYATPTRVWFDIAETAIDTLDDFLGYEDVLAEPDILVGSNRQHYDVTPQVRFAGDDAVYGAWQDYVPGQINARYFQFRLVLKTRLANIVPVVSEFTWTVDVPDITQKGEKITVPAAGLRIDYAKPFHAEPNVQIAIFDAVDGDRYVLTNADETGFDIATFNQSTQVARVINWISQGY